MNYDSQRFNKQQGETESLNEIEQYYGNGNLFEQQKLSGASKPIIKKPTKKRDPFALLKTLDNFPIKREKGYLFLVILVSVMSVWILAQLKYEVIFTFSLLIGATFLAWKKVNFHTNDGFEHYLSNATITLKGLFRQSSMFSMILPYSRHLLLTVVTILAIESVFLRLMFPLVLTNAIYSLVYFGLFIGIALCFANRQYSFLHQVLTLYSLSNALEIVIFALKYNQLHLYTGVSFLFFWTVASHFKVWSELKEQPFNKKSI